MPSKPSRADKADPPADQGASLAELRRPDGFTAALLGHVAEGLCVTDAQGKIEFVDPKFAHMFGYAEAELVGGPLERLNGADMLQQVRSLASAGAAKTIDLDCHRKDGSKVLCAWSGTHVGTGPDLRLLFVVADVTHRRRADQIARESDERLKEIQRLRELDNVKTQFINNAAHELKTPLTPIKVQTHLLRTALGEGLSPDQRQSIDILHRNLERLRHLVDDVLEAARIQANRLQVVKQPLDLNPLVLETVESFKAVAAQVGIAIEWRYCEKPYVEADPQRMTQVVYNLLSNAVKFTPPGGRVAVETSKSHTEAFVRVKDTGHGLTSEQISRLFKPFSQVHDPMQDTRAGTGLGLFISHGIVQEHGGRIWAESPGPGRGSIFVVALPLTQKEVGPTPDRRVAPESLSMRPPKGAKRDPALARRLRELI